MATVSILKSQTNETDIVAWARDFVVELRGAQSESDRLARPYGEHFQDSEGIESWTRRLVK